MDLREAFEREHMRDEVELVDWRKLYFRLIGAGFIDQKAALGALENMVRYNTQIDWQGEVCQAMAKLIASEKLCLYELQSDEGVKSLAMNINLYAWIVIQAVLAKK